MKNDVAGISIPDTLIERMKKAEDPKQEGINICIDIIKELKKIKGVKGIHIMPVGCEAPCLTLSKVLVSCLSLRLNKLVCKVVNEL